MTTPALMERIVAEVGSWSGVVVGGHRFGGTAFRLGPREVGHVHDWGSVDVAFPMRVRDLLVEREVVDPHPVYPLSGWTTRAVREPTDVEDAIRVLRLSYVLNAVSVDHPVDVDGEMTALGFDAPIVDYVAMRVRRHQRREHRERREGHTPTTGRSSTSRAPERPRGDGEPSLSRDAE